MNEELKKEAFLIIMQAFVVLLKTKPHMSEDDWDLVGLATSLVALELMSMEEGTTHAH